MIYITGDTHGDIDFDKIKKYFKKVYCSEKEYLIILGDAGIVWEKENKDILFKYYLIGITIIFIDGNHENFDLLKTYPIVTFHNAKAHKVYDTVKSRFLGIQFKKKIRVKKFPYIINNIRNFLYFVDFLVKMY